MIKKIYAAAKLLLLVILILSGEAIPQIEKITDVHNVNSPLNQKQSLQKINSVEKESYEELPIIKPDFMVNSVGGDYGAEQRDSDIAMDSSGNYAVAWIDKRNGIYQGYIQFYNNNDEKIGSNMRFTHAEVYSSPTISVNKKGDFIVVWIQNEQIIGQRFTKNGVKSGFNFVISAYSGYNTYDVSITINDDGSFLTAWKTHVGIFIRIFDQNGVAVGEENRINLTGSSTSDRSNKFTAVDGNGNYVIVWSSSIGGSYSGIYLQKIDKEGQLIDGNILVSNPGNNFNNVFPSVAATDDGHFLIVWGIEGDYPNPKKTAGRIYHSSGFISEPTQFYDTESWSNLITVTSDRKNTFILIYRGNNFYCRKISTALEVSPDKKMELNQTLPDFFDSNISEIYSDHFLISTELYFKADPDIYVHKINSDTYASVSFKKINDDQGSSTQREAITYFNAQGNSIVLWRDERNGGYDLYAQVYNVNFQPVGENILVNDVIEGRSVYRKVVSSLSDGTFVIAFTGITDGYKGDVYFQLVDPQGIKIDNNKLVKEYTFSLYNLSINANDKEEILLCWYDDMDSFLRKFNKDLVPVSPEINFMKYSIYNTFISIDEHLNLFASWVPSTGNSKIFSLIFDQTGRAISDTIRIDVSEGGYPYYLVNSIDGTNNLFVAWRNSMGVSLLRTYKDEKEYTSKNILNSNVFRSFPKIICFKNRKGLLAWNTGTNVNGFYFNDNRRESVEYKLQQLDYPYDENWLGDIFSVSLYEDKLFTAFESARNGGTGYDIWANVKRLSNVNFKKEAFFPPVNDDFIYTNFPNPFNSSTTIVYELLSFHKVNLSVHDILGREVKTLVDEYQEKGLYEIKFDASDLPSGVYFYKLDSFRTIIKKMILIK